MHPRLLSQATLYNYTVQVEIVCSYENRPTVTYVTHSSLQKPWFTDSSVLLGSLVNLQIAELCD